MSDLHFARPWLLLLMLLPILAWPVRGWLKLRQQRRWRKLGNPAMLARFVVHPHRPSLWRSLVRLLAWLVLVLAIAGPRWGRVPEAGVAIGRDVVLVLDFSRSMWAMDMNSSTAPSRWQAAVSAAKTLVRACRERGGDRVALVLFAARPTAIAPLTTDYDHLLFQLDALDARHPPAEVQPDREDAPSGTRIGSALRLALEQHDERFPGFQEIVLLTDADDPAADAEWRIGTSAARQSLVPVHVVGLGDPRKVSMIFRGDAPIEGLTVDGLRSPVLTRLHDDVARAIATDARGEYLAAAADIPDLAAFHQRVIAGTPSRELSEDRRPQPRDRSAAFYAVTMALLCFVWCCPRRGV